MMNENIKVIGCKRLNSEYLKLCVLCEYLQKSNECLGFRIKHKRIYKYN